MDFLMVTIILIVIFLLIFGGAIISSGVENRDFPTIILGLITVIIGAVIIEFNICLLH